MTTLSGKVQESADAIAGRINAPWSEVTALVLGSGFREFVDEIQMDAETQLAEIPHFNAPKVAGHGSRILSGNFEGKPILIFSGRSHLYEGYSPESVVHPIRTLARLGVKRLVLTNASGSVNKQISAGQLVALADHINLTGRNCLIGSENIGGPQFVDMINAYDFDWRTRVTKALNIREAVYLGLMGPNYETPAETKMARTLGADLVGMSTVQETMAARQLGMTVMGLSLVTNMAGGLAEEVNHEEVLEMGRNQASNLRRAVGQAIITAP